MSTSLQSERLILRPFTEADLPFRASYQSMLDVSRFLYRPPLTEEASRESALANPDRRFSDDGDRLLFAVARVSDGAVLGEVVLTLNSAHASRAEIGWIFHPDSAGHGYATEAARLLVDHAFAVHVVHRVFARLDAANDASRRVCERVGMRQEAHLRENDLDGDRWGSEYVYAVLASEWNEVR